jgi:hypothetical protein
VKQPDGVILNIDIELDGLNLVEAVDWARLGYDIQRKDWGDAFVRYEADEETGEPHLIYFVEDRELPFFALADDIIERDWRVEL